MFAVVELQGHQYIVRPNDTIVVDKMELESSTVVVHGVLMVAEEDGSHVTVGTPYVEGTTVTFDVVTDFQKGEKIRVLKFKRKNRYQRIIGFRPHQTVLKVSSIGEAKKAKKAEKEVSMSTEHNDEHTTQEAPKKTTKKVKAAEEVTE